MPGVSAIVAAAGESSRLAGEVRKPYLILAGKPVIVHSVERLAAVNDIGEFVIMVHPDDLDHAKREFLQTFRSLRPTTIAAGAHRRQDTVRKAIELIRPDSDLVLIHDAVRPLVRKKHIAQTIRKAHEVGAAILASPVRPTIKKARAGVIEKTVSRHDLWAAQTPQVFRRSLLVQAYRQAEENGIEVTDDAEVVEHVGHAVAIVEGPDDNIKITFPADIAVAEVLLKQIGSDA